MNNCVVRVLGPAVAKLIVPRTLGCTNMGSSGRVVSHFVVSSGSEAIPNWMIKPDNKHGPIGENKKQKYQRVCNKNVSQHLFWIWNNSNDRYILLLHRDVVALEPARTYRERHERIRHNPNNDPIPFDRVDRHQEETMYDWIASLTLIFWSKMWLYLWNGYHPLWWWWVSFGHGIHPVLECGSLHHYCHNHEHGVCIRIFDTKMLMMMIIICCLVPRRFLSYYSYVESLR